MALRIRTEHPYVVRVPTIAEGRPLVADTRLTVASLAREIALGRSSLAVAALHPQVSPAAFHSALSYYYDHKTEIDRDLLLDDLASLGAVTGTCPILAP